MIYSGISVYLVSNPASEKSNLLCTAHRIDGRHRSGLPLRLLIRSSDNNTKQVIDTISLNSPNFSESLRLRSLNRWIRGYRTYFFIVGDSEERINGKCIQGEIGRSGEVLLMRGIRRRLGSLSFCNAWILITPVRWIGKEIWWR